MEGPDPHMWIGNFERTNGQPRTCLVVDILKATQQGAARVQCSCSLGCTRWVAYWRNLENTFEPFVCGGDTAYVKLLWPLYYYYCYKKKRFRWRNVKKTARTPYSAKTVTKWECDAKMWNRVSVRCGRRQSCRDQESFGQTVPSSTDAWRTPVKITM